MKKDVKNFLHGDIKIIAAETGLCRQTVSKRLKAGDPVITEIHRKMINERVQMRITELMKELKTLQNGSTN